MKGADHLTVRMSAKAVAPIASLVAVSVAIGMGAGAGLASGLMLSAVLMLHAIVLGASAAQRAFTPFVWRATACLALFAGSVAVSAPDWRYAALLGEIALAASIVAATGLAFVTLAARAPSLRDEEW